MVSAAARRSILVPKNRGRRGRPKEFFSKIPERMSFHPQNFLMTFFSRRKLQQNNYAATMASATHSFISLCWMTVSSSDDVCIVGPQTFEPEPRDVSRR